MHSSDQLSDESRTVCAVVVIQLVRDTRYDEVCMCDVLYVLHGAVFLCPRLSIFICQFLPISVSATPMTFLGSSSRECSRISHQGDTVTAVAKMVRTRSTSTPLSSNLCHRPFESRSTRFNRDMYVANRRDQPKTRTRQLMSLLIVFHFFERHFYSQVP